MDITQETAVNLLARGRARRLCSLSLPITLPIACAALLVACGGGDSGAAPEVPEPTPDFGANVTIFDPSISVDTINAKLVDLSKRSNGFDENRSAVLFMPGTYGSASGQYNPSRATGHVNSPVGFMTTIQGLGASPTDVTINGNLRAGAAGQNALATFWRSLSNMRIIPIQGDETPFTMRWSTSQASPLRRLDIMGNLDLKGGNSFGNFIANSRVAGEVQSGALWKTDQTAGSTDLGPIQYFMRDSTIGDWAGRGADITLSGVVGAPATQFAPGDKTRLEQTQVSREAPFLYVDGTRFKVFVPALRKNTSGASWGVAASDGVSLPISSFYIAKPADTAVTINAALAQGKNLLLTPGVYKVDRPIQVTRADTVVMGLGLATVTPLNGTEAIKVDDVPGVILSSFIVDANTVKSAVLVQVGPPGASKGNLDNPTTLNDIFIRVGGSYVASATTSLEINQNAVLIDHTWLWRADHGNAGTSGWAVNTSEHGIVVNGDNVTALGLFVEHHQKTQAVWNGNGGRTIFMQCEPPYDPPSQAAWMNGNLNGYPCYSVADGVTSHTGVGMISWTLFFSTFGGPPIYASSSITAPVTPNVRFVNTTAGVIAGTGGFQHIINEVGPNVDPATSPSFAVGLAAIYQMAAFPAP